MPVYTPNIPQPSDDPSVSQNQILENFQTLDTAFSQDHGAYNSATEGLHHQVTFPVGPLAGQPFTYLAGEIGLQSLDQAPTSRPDIWLTRGAGTAFPATGYSTGGTNVANGWTYLPSGVLLAWGRATIPAPGSLTVTYAAELLNFPGFSTFWGPPQVVRISSGATITATVFLNAFTQTTFTANTSQVIGGTSDFAWFAMGL